MSDYSYVKQNCPLLYAELDKLGIWGMPIQNGDEYINSILKGKTSYRVKPTDPRRLSMDRAEEELKKYQQANRAAL